MEQEEKRKSKEITINVKPSWKPGEVGKLFIWKKRATVNPNLSGNPRV